MGSLKRKNYTPPVSPPASKRSARDESPVSLSPNGDRQDIAPARVGGPNFTTSEQIGGQCYVEQVQATPNEETAKSPDFNSRGIENTSKILVGEQGTITLDSKASTADVDQGDINKDGSDDIDGARTDKDQDGAKTCGEKRQSQTNIKHLIPNHAGWFSWNNVHALEQRGLPEFFNGKSRVKTPALYKEYRNMIIKKYMENPDRLLVQVELPDIIPGNREAGRRIFEFLDHWGLINYRALVIEQPSFTVTSASVEEQCADLQYQSQSNNQFSNLYHFDLSESPLVAKSNTFSAKAVPSPALAEAAILDLLIGSQGPAVEYHCNSCSADCSKRRYHCQKQADFDLCPDCFNDGKFSFGMATTDFILMEALTEGTDTSRGGWTDQETLLLLEALELYGDNWNEIAEHVATKTKAQCILHFIRLPIEDPFLEAMETSSGISTVHAVSDSGGANKGSVQGAQGEGQFASLKNMSNDSSKQKLSDSDNLISGKVHDDGGGGETNRKKEESSVAIAINTAIQAAGLYGLDKPIAFSECGNPVMALVAFLVALVGPDIAASAAQTALKVLSERDPVAQLAAKNSHTLETQDTRNDAERISFDRKDSLNVEGSPVEAHCSIPIEVDGNHAGFANVEDGNKEINACTSRAGQTTVANDDELTPDGKQVPYPVLEDKGTSSLEKLRNAAATALAAAAIKAKLLADKEEQEILQLAASVVDSQLKKLEIKLLLFRELDMILNKEHEQMEKARHRLLSERAQILAAHLSPPGTSVQNTVTSPALKASFSPTGVTGCSSVPVSAVVMSASGPTDSSKGISISSPTQAQASTKLALPVLPATVAKVATTSQSQRLTVAMSGLK